MSEKILIPLLIIKYAAMLLLVRIPMILIGCVVLAVVLPFISKKRETLPRAFRYFDNIWAHRYGYPYYTADLMVWHNKPKHYRRMVDPIDGLSGSPRWRWPVEWQRAKGYDNPVEGYTGYPFIKYNYFKHLYQRYRWLAIRNPVNYFSYKVLGHTIENKLQLINSRASTDKGIRSYWVLAKDGSKSLYELSLSGNYSLLGIKRNIDLRIGHKIASNGDPVEDLKKGKVLQFTFRINPFRSPR